MSIPPPYTLTRISRLRSDQTLDAPGNQTRFYLQQKTWTTGPHYMLLDGPAETSPRIAAWKTHTFGDNEVCLGDLETPDCVWIPLEKGSMLSGKRYMFSAPDTGRRFLLERSHDKQYGLSRFMNKGFLLTDEASGNLVAIWRILSYNGKERCAFEWQSAVSWTEEVLCLMAMVGVFEKLRAQHNSSSSSGSAGAGAGGGGGGC